MKKKFILLIILCLSLSLRLSAQEKFIEVFVKDTVALKPISFSYEVSSGLKLSYDYNNPNSEIENSKKLRESEKKIERLLNKWNYNFTLNGNPDVNFTRDPTDKINYTVKITDPLKREEFKARMKKEGINFFISNIEYEKKETKIKEIYIRLLKKARERAELIASLSNKKVGEIIGISESKSELGIVSSFIEKFSYSRSNGASSTSFSFNTGVFEKSILIRYSLK